MAFLHSETLAQLEALNFDGKAEAFVEAKFLTPFLECLGYETHKDYEVIRHGDDGSMFKLKAPPVESGATKVRNYSPDYFPTIRKKCFWIIEAKSPTHVSYPFDLKYLVQGLQYCVHPEIQAKYLLVSNGQNSAIYDAHGSIFLDKELYSPIVEFKATELRQRWYEIFELLSVERLRTRIETDLKTMFDKLCLSSLDKNYPKKLLATIGASAREHSKKIEKHYYKLYVEEMDRQRDEWRAEMEKLRPTELLPLMDLPPRPAKCEVHYFIEKSRQAGSSLRDIFTAITNDYEHQCIFRKEQTFIGLCVLYYAKDDSITAEVKKFFSQYAEAELPLHNQIECALLRFTRKILVCSHYPALQERIRNEMQTAPEMLRLINPPTALSETYPYEIELHRKRFELMKKVPENQIPYMLEQVEKIEAPMETSYSLVRSRLTDSEKQMGGFEGYGGKKHYAFPNIIRNCGIALGDGTVPPVTSS